MFNKKVIRRHLTVKETVDCFLVYILICLNAGIWGYFFGQLVERLK